ncbi:DMT family transporter [Streptomyces sp. BI20]|uniref:DMT family transporter n=1 Tax=Streptomyces sp. BI20 TaxID=3403460 RepID=UPI003C766588
MGGVVPVLAAAVLWGTVGPAQLLAGRDIDPVALGACRMLLGGLALALVTARPAGLRTLTARAVRGPLAAGILTTAAFQVCFLQAVERGGAAVATAVTFGTVPVAGGLCARILTGERTGPRWPWGTACAVLGIGLMLLPGSGGRVDAVGLCCAVAAGVAFGAYIPVVKLLGARGAELAAASPVCVFGAGLLVSPYLFAVGDPGPLGSARGLALVAWLGLGTTALGYLLFTRGVTRISAGTAGTLSLTEPLVATGLGVLLLGERPGAPAAVGAALLLGGLIVVSLPMGEHPRRPAPPHRPATPPRAPTPRPRTPQPPNGTGPGEPAQRSR